LKNENSFERISNAFKTKLPKFQSHIEAKKYLQEQFGSRFVFHKNIDDEKETSYLYHLKLNVEFYDKGIVKFKMRKFSLADDDCFNFMDSYQPVIISEDGDVHFH